MQYVIQKEDNKGPSGLAVKFGAPARQWPEFCKANPKLAKHPTYGCVYYVGNTVNIPDNWPLAQPAIPPPGPNAPPGPPGPAPVGPSAPVGPAAPIEPARAGMFGAIDSKTILIGAGLLAVGVVAIYALKKKSNAQAA